MCGRQGREKEAFHVKRRYQLPLGALARLLLWSNGELGTDEVLEREMSQYVGLLRAKLRAIEVQLMETAAARKAQKPEGRPDGVPTLKQGELPWEDPEDESAVARDESS